MKERRPRVAVFMALLIVVGVAAASSIVTAQSSTTGTPTSDDAERAVRIDERVSAYMQATGIPGAQLAIVSGGRLALLRHYGMASIELAVPVSDASVFAVNSIAKVFTGVAVMRLVQAGRVDLDASIGTYLQDLPESWRLVTVRQLLSHMSGLPEILRAPTAETDENAAWDWVRTQPLAFARGERFSYNQTNYWLLQRMINTLRGLPPQEAPGLEQFALVGMPGTRYGDTGDLIPNKGPSYRRTATGAGQPRVLRPVVERFLPSRHGASGLNTTAADMAAWVIALERGALLQPDTREALWTPAKFSDGTTGQWAMGWQVLQRGSLRVVGMTGGGRAAFSIYPEQRLAVILLTNLAGAYPEDLVDTIASLYAPALTLTGVPALRTRLEATGFADVPGAAAAVERDSPGMAWPEGELNDWGYRLLSTGRANDALAVFAFIVDRFPRSGNAHDSLAEAYATIGDTPAAVRHYRRSLELDPQNTNARSQLERLAPANQPRH